MSGRTAKSDTVFGMEEDFDFTNFEDLGLEEGIVVMCPGLEKKPGWYRDIGIWRETVVGVARTQLGEICAKCRSCSYVCLRICR